MRAVTMIAILLAADVLCACAAGAVQAPPRASVAPLFERELTDVPGKTFTSITVDDPPGARSAPHRHGHAFVDAHALQGATEAAKLLVVFVSNTGEALKTDDPEAGVR